MAYHVKSGDITLVKNMQNGLKIQPAQFPPTHPLRKEGNEIILGRHKYSDVNSRLSLF